MKSFIALLAVQWVFQSVWAIQEYETVVTDTKFNSSSRVIINKAEIDKSRAKDVTTLLATQANISIVQSNFTPTSIFMRGGDSSHILILIDGVPFYDASSVQRTFNLNTLDIKSIQKIEVIKGSQSVLYGGQALTGVIKIDTIPKEIKSSGQVLASGGNFNQASLAAGGLLALNDQVGVLARGSISQKFAKSPVLNSDQQYPLYLNTGELAAVYRGPVAAVFKVQNSFDRHYISTTANPSFLAADTEGFVSSTSQTTATAFFNANNFRFKPLLAVSAQRNARQFEQDFTNGLGSPTKQDYVGELLAARMEVTPLDFDYFVLKLGGSINSEKMLYRDFDILKSDVSDEFEGFFAKIEVPITQNIQIEAGSRLDYRRMKNEIATHQFGLTLFEVLKLEYATGFKHPSLFQLYSSYGNANLKPERSTSYSVTLESNLNADLFASITGFETRFENLILTRGFPPIYDNISSSKTVGAELVGGYRWLEQSMNFTVTLGYQEPKDLEQGTWLPRRPLRTASLKVRKEFSDFSVGLDLVHNGDRRDRTGATSYGLLNPYTLVHVIAEYQVLKDLALFTRVQNLFDQRYESNYGFYDEGLNVIAGAEYSF